MDGGRPRAYGGQAGGWQDRCRTVIAAALAVQLSVALAGVMVHRWDPSLGGSSAVAAPDGAPPAPAAVAEVPPPAPAAPAPAPALEPPPVPAAAAPAGQPPPPPAPPPSLPSPPPQVGASLVAPDPGPASAPGPGATQVQVPVSQASAGHASDSERIFAQEHPLHAQAAQRDDQPSTFHWAVIIGVNDYGGATSSTVGSVGDALTLQQTLLRHGWRGDQVLTLTDGAATHDGIVRALEWLSRSTDGRSTVVFSFSGHLRHESGATAVWPSDNRFLWAGDLGRLLGAVRADRLWVTLQGCHAAGLAGPGVEGPGRITTYSSRWEQKSYEDPQTGYSVMGQYLFAEGLRDGLGDRYGNQDGRVSVAEAFAWAAPRAEARTRGQRYGPQTPVKVDGLGGRQFHLEVTGAPAVAASR